MQLQVKLAIKYMKFGQIRNNHHFSLFSKVKLNSMVFVLFQLIYNQFKSINIVLMMLHGQQNQFTSKRLEEICHHIKISHYSNAYHLCQMLEKQMIGNSKIEFSPHLLLNKYSKKEVGQALQLLEVQSLKSYCLINLNQFDEARQILTQCLKIFPNHAPSQRRLASLNQKEGDLQQSLNIMKKMALYEPDNVHLANSIMKTSKKLKSLSKSSSLQKIETEQISMTTLEQEQNSSKNKQHVTFGTSEIIQITSDQSDEYFAHIKQEINKLNQKKPKKSILKGSNSKINKDAMSNPTYTHSEQEKTQIDQIIVKKTLSMKSCSTQSPLKWESDSLQDQKLMNSVKKQKKKKKCVSFSVGKDNQQDKQ